MLIIEIFQYTNHSPLENPLTATYKMTTYMEIMENDISYLGHCSIW